MAWDTYTIVARKKSKGAEKFEIISVSRNGEPCEENVDLGESPDFSGPPPDDKYKNCIYMGGAGENACRWLWGKWW